MIKAVKRILFGVAVLAAASLFLANGSLLSYDLIGHNLGLSQRDFRIYNNFQDASANDNTTADPDFGGLSGCFLALSKGALEWASQTVGLSTWGTGGANFDPFYAGEASSAGGISANIMSADTGNGGNVIAYMQGGGGGWRIRYYENWTWHDGPDNAPSGGNNMDFQGIACHEYGHALGLDHSAVTSATMYAYASGSGNAQRTIANDDRNGVQAIYGAASTDKPVILALAGSTDVGGTLEITGANFSPSANEVWFTGDGGAGSALVVSNVSSSGGGTQISVVIPSGAFDGFVAVKNNGSGHSALSNVFPLDIGGSTPGNQPVPDILVNGTDTPPAVHTSEFITVTISLDPGDQDGEPADWWVYVTRDSPANTWWRKYNGGWTKSGTPIRFAGADLQPVNNYTVIGPLSLAAGVYEWTFAVDEMNSIVEGTYSDSVIVLVYN